MAPQGLGGTFCCLPSLKLFGKTSCEHGMPIQCENEGYALWEPNFSSIGKGLYFLIQLFPKSWFGGGNSFQAGRQHFEKAGTTCHLQNTSLPPPGWWELETVGGWGGPESGVLFGCFAHYLLFHASGLPFPFLPVCLHHHLCFLTVEQADRSGGSLPASSSYSPMPTKSFSLPGSTQASAILTLHLGLRQEQTAAQGWQGTFPPAYGITSLPAFLKHRHGTHLFLLHACAGHEHVELPHTLPAIRIHAPLLSLYVVLPSLLLYFSPEGTQ